MSGPIYICDSPSMTMENMFDCAPRRQVKVPDKKLLIGGRGYPMCLVLMHIPLHIGHIPRGRVWWSKHEVFSTYRVLRFKLLGGS